MTDNNDLYAGDDSSGLLTHFIGRVNKGLWSTFFAETDGQVSGDFAQTTLWFGHVDVLDILQANYSTSGPPVESILASFGIGNGWQQDANDPNLVEHEDDTETNRPRFRGNTAFMKVAYLISGQNDKYDNAVVLDGDSPNINYDMQGVRKVHAERGIKTLRDASLYDGCIFEWRGLGFPTRQNPKPDRPKPYPTRYLGYSVDEVVDLSTLDTGSGHSTNNSSGAARRGLGSVPAEVVEQWQSVGASEPTVAVLTRLYEASPTLDHFINNAGMLPDVKASEQLASIIVDTPDPFEPLTSEAAE